MKTAILGGTFNPVHNGHLNLMRIFLEKINPDRLILLPCCIPPHKQAENLAGTRQRLEMCYALSGVDSRITVSDYEIINGGKNYTADTLEFLKRLYPQDKLYLIVGSDMFMSLNEWRDPQRIFKNAVICATYRNHIDDIEKMRAYARNVLGLGEDSYILCESEPFEVSSTQIRDMVRAGEDISALVPKSVLDIIEKEGLYRD